MLSRSSVTEEFAVVVDCPHFLGRGGDYMSPGI